MGGSVAAIACSGEHGS